MMYKDKFICCLKTNGKILREDGENVYIPFGSEYIIFFKNLTLQKAIVKISIDGEDILDKHSLIVDANSTVELDGYLKDTVAKNSFKFIKKTKEISDFRGDRIDDGILRIEFTYEKLKPEVYPYWPYPVITYYNVPTLDNFSYIAEKQYLFTTTDKTIVSSAVNNSNLSSMCMNNSSEPGISVRGSEISQKFNYGYVGNLEEQSHILILCLKGIDEKQKEIQKPLLVSSKLQCKTCGKLSNSNFKFCSKCGTFLNH